MIEDIEAAIDALEIANSNIDFGILECTEAAKALRDLLGRLDGGDIYSYKELPLLMVMEPDKDYRVWVEEVHD